MELKQKKKKKLNLPDEADGFGIDRLKKRSRLSKTQSTINLDENPTKKTGQKQEITKSKRQSFIKRSSP